MPPPCCCSAPGQRASLADLLGDAALADDLLSRIEAAGTVALHPAACRAARHSATSASPLKAPATAPADDAAFALLLLDDVTERRALELPARRCRTRRPRPARHAAAEPAAPHRAAAVRRPMPPSSRSSARRWRRASASAPAPARARTCRAGRAGRAAPTAPARRRRGASCSAFPTRCACRWKTAREAVLVAKDGQLLFANPAAARLFGYETGEDVINDEALSATSASLASRCPAPTSPPIAASTIAGQRADDGDPLARRPGPPVRAAARRSRQSTAARRAAAGAGPRQLEATAEAASTGAAPPPRPQHEPAPPKRHGRGDPASPAPQPPRRPTRNCAPFSTPPPTASSRSIRMRASTPSAPGPRRSSAIASPRWRESPSSTFWRPRAARRCATIWQPCRARASPRVFNDGREVTALVRQGGTVPLFLTIGKLQAHALAGRLLRRGARHHAVEEDRSRNCARPRSGPRRRAGRSRSSSPASAMSCERRSTPSWASRK